MDAPLSRRDALKGLGLGGMAMAAGVTGCRTVTAMAAPPAGAGGGGEFKLMPLPYTSLEPVIDDQTLALHHDKHNAGYVKGANAALAKLAAARATGDTADVKPLLGALAYNGSGAVLHALYWQSMWPGGRGKPSDAMAAAIQASFGSEEKMRAQFAAASKKVEASGWGVLAWDPVSGRLVTLQCEKHQNETIWGCVPLLVCDVWEHAYYLKYQNARGAYVDAWMDIIDWTSASARFAAAMA